MWLQAIAERSGKNSDGRQGCLVGRRDMPREFFAWGCGQFSMVRGRKVQEKNRHEAATERRNGRRRKPFLGR